MQIVFVAPQMLPFAGSGNLAQDVGGLAAALSGSGVRVTVVLPRDPGDDASGAVLSRRLLPLEVEHGGRTHRFVVHDGRFGSQVDVLLLERDARESSPTTDGDDPQDVARWALFCRATVELLSREGRVVDVLHLHDWESALVAHLLAERGSRPNPLSNTAVVLTIHDITRQGVAQMSLASSLGLGSPDRDSGVLEHHGKLNALRAGIAGADRIFTVSPRHAREIVTGGGGAGLEDVLEALPHPPEGILGGIDTERHDPASGDGLESPFGPEDPTGRSDCKKALQQRVGLAPRQEPPLFSMCGPWNVDRGVDLLLAMAPRLLRSDVQLVVAGEGDADLSAGLENLRSRYPEKVALLAGSPEAVLASVLAGSDVALIPARTDPSGRAALMAMRYGAVPVVTGVGGLADAVVDVDRHLETGNGFICSRPDPVDFLGAALRATVARTGEKEWKGLVRRILATDVGWRNASRRTRRIYERLTSRPDADDS